MIHVAGYPATTGVLDAGHPATVRRHWRQRCAWCGALLLDFTAPDRLRVLWPLGALVDDDHPGGRLIEPVGDGLLPAPSCGALDPEVTR